MSHDVRTISFEHQWTGEKLNVPYYERGHVQIDALVETDHLLRDSRNDKTHPTDPAMLDILVAMRQRLGTDAPFYVMCGYRSPETNEMLAEQGGGVAKNSYHMAGEAIDIRMPNAIPGPCERARLICRLAGSATTPVPISCISTQVRFAAGPRDQSSLIGLMRGDLAL